MELLLKRSPLPVVNILKGALSLKIFIKQGDSCFI